MATELRDVTNEVAADEEVAYEGPDRSLADEDEEAFLEQFAAEDAATDPVPEILPLVLADADYQDLQEIASAWQQAQYAVQQKRQDLAGAIEEEVATRGAHNYFTSIVRRRYKIGPNDRMDGAAIIRA